jgi:serine/threonine-protein kinase RsbW
VVVAALDRLLGVIGLRVPGSLAYRHLAIRFVATACKIALDADTDANDFEPEVISAFGEAFNNVAVHGFRDVPAEPVQIEIDWDDEKLVITMIDTGRTFDPASVAPPELDDLPESGMGLFIMTSCMDVVDYQPGPPNVLRLVKMRQREGLLPPAPGNRGSAPRSDFHEVDDDPTIDDMAHGAPTSGSAIGDEVSAGDRGSGVVATETDAMVQAGDGARTAWR